VSHPLEAPAANPFSSHVLGDLTTGSTVPTVPGWMKVDQYPPFLGPAVADGTYATYRAGWIKVGEQYIRYDSAHNNGAFGALPIHLLNVNLAEWPFGKMSAPIKPGEVVTWLDWIDTFEADAHDALGSAELLRASVAGSEIVVRASATDPDAGQPWALQLPPIEALVQDARYGYTGAAARAAEDLLFFKTPAMKAEWTTEDYNARPGREQLILLSDVDPVQASLTILTVELEFPARTLAPRRRCTAGTVKAATLLDVLLTSDK
jgi:hypothetical protein